MNIKIRNGISGLEKQSFSKNEVFGIPQKSQTEFVVLKSTNFQKSRGDF